MAIAVKKHWQEPMAFVTFETPEVAQALLEDPPPMIADVPVFQPIYHRNDASTLVFRWHSAGDLSERIIGEFFLAAFAAAQVDHGGTSKGKGKGKGKDLEHADKEWLFEAVGFSCVFRVKKHWERPMAFVTFTSEDLAAMVIANPPAQICGVPCLPPKQHKDDPKAVVLRWRDGKEPDQEAIAYEFEARLVAQLEGKEVPNDMMLEDTGTPSVAFVKMHWQQPMAFITFQDAGLAQVVLNNPPPVLGDIPVAPARAHTEDPTTIVLRWPEGSPVTEQALGDFFEGYVATCLASEPEPAPPEPTGLESWEESIHSALEGFTSTASESWSQVEQLASVLGIAPPSQLAPPPAANQAAPAPQLGAVPGGQVMAVKQDWHQPVAFITFSSPDCVPVACASVREGDCIAGIPVMPPVRKADDPASIILRWANGQILSELAIQQFFQRCLMEGPPPGVIPDPAPTSQLAISAQANPLKRKLDSPAGPSGVHNPFEAQWRKVMSSTPGAAPLAQQPGHRLQSPGQQLPHIKTVSKHKMQPLMFVTFTSAAAAQICVTSPPASIAGVNLQPARPHATDPMSVVVRWDERFTLTEPVIARELSSYVSTLLPQGLADSAPSAATGMAPGAVDDLPTANAVVTRVKKHYNQPMAYITFAAADIAEAVLAQPPTQLCGVDIMPPKAHLSDVRTIVLRWNMIHDISEGQIADDLQRYVIVLAGAAAANLANAGM